ncbi:hypothetical protein PMAYCL1PPCAC_08249, partial [Pristionchus mayeri]
MFNGGDRPFSLLSGKLARLILGVFQKGLLLGMYSAPLLTALLTPVDNAPIKSQSDAVNLIKSGDYKLISDESRWFAQEMAFSSEKLFEELREATKNNPLIDPVSYQHALDLVGQGGNIYQAQTDEAATTEAAGKCYTFVYSEGDPFRSAHFLIRKNSSWLADLNREIMRNYAAIEQIYKRYFE